jgi:hypothetical protein
MSLLVGLRSDPKQPRSGLFASMSCCQSDWTTISLRVVHFADSLLIEDFQNSRRIQEGRQSSLV